MSQNKGLLNSGLRMVGRNKRYIFWFWLLNLALAWFGTSVFRNSASSILDHSSYSDRLLHGFDLSVLLDLLSQPEFPSPETLAASGLGFAILFFLATALFLPGVFQGYASTYRLPREDFFRACGRNLWRFIRLIIVAAVVMGVVSGILLAITGAVVKKAGESTNELLPFRLRLTALATIFLVMTTLRICFDLAEADIVLNDQRAVRKSIGTAFGHTFRSLGRLLLSYVIAAVVAAIILLAGLWSWMKFVRPDNVVAAFLIAQVTLFLFLIPRFWQRGVAVSYWQRKMMVPAVAMEPVAPAPAPATAPNAPPATAEP